MSDALRQAIMDSFGSILDRVTNPELRQQIEAERDTLLAGISPSPSGGEVVSPVGLPGGVPPQTA